MSAATPSALLDRLAASLGCSPEVFFGQAPNELSDMLELLTLWLATKDRPTRMRALAVLRGGPRQADMLDTDPALTRAMQSPGEVP